MKNKNTLIKGSLFLGLGAFISKFLGAVYRIPLLNLITSEGMGLYQMVFPVYCILLDFAGLGAPNAISKLISSKSEKDRDVYSKRYLKNSLIIFSILGLLFSCIMLFLAKQIATLQGNRSAYFGYMLLAPAVVLVSLISCFRGYFQGKLNMLPTAVSQIIEQAVKLIFGLLFAYIFMPNLYLAVGGTTLAISISEAVALLYLFLTYRAKNRLSEPVKTTKQERRLDRKKIILLTIPITLIGIAIPFANFIDSFLVVNILKNNFDNATSLYGLYSGATLSIINLPVSICYGIAVVAIPYLSSERNKRERQKITRNMLLLTFFASLVFAVFIYFLSPYIVRFLYRKMSAEEKTTTVRLIKLMSISIVLLSVLQTQNSILISNGQTYFPLYSMGIGVFIKTFVTIILLNNVNINIYGAGIGLIACYFVAILINFIRIIGERKKQQTKRLRVCTT